MTVLKNTRSEQARINGAKSKGPISIDGKARSSQNAIQHGFAAVINTVISIEDIPAFDRHVAGYRASFLPNTYAEETLVDQLASINWRQSRLVALETALIDAQLSIQREAVCAYNPGCAENPYYHLVLAWQALARQPYNTEPVDPMKPPIGYDINSIELVRRYLTSLDRQFRNTLLNLRQCRKDFSPAPKEPEEVAAVAPASVGLEPASTTNATSALPIPPKPGLPPVSDLPNEPQPSGRGVRSSSESTLTPGKRNLSAANSRSQPIVKPN